MCSKVSLWSKIRPLLLVGIVGKRNYSDLARKHSTEGYSELKVKKT